MVLDRVLAQRRELVYQRLSRRHAEGCADPYVLQYAALVVEPEEERADRVLAALVPAEARHRALGGTRVLHLDHRALAGEVRARLGLRDDAVEPGALEARQPVERD